MADVPGYMIEIENLSHRFADGTQGIDNVSLQISTGELVVIAGPNGSGKSTLVRHINGLLRSTGGRVRLAGGDVSRDPARARQLAGMVFQDADSQIVGETVYDDVAFGPENLGLAREEVTRRVAEALAATGLSRLADQRPHLLSGGEKRRLSIAGVLAMAPRVIIFDEPFASLDYAGVKQVLAQILSLHQDGRTLLVITHELEKILAHADRLIVMEKGRIALNGRPAGLLEKLEACGVKAPCRCCMGSEALAWPN